MNGLDLCLEVVSRSCQPLRSFDVEYLGNQRPGSKGSKGPPIGNGTCVIKWSRDRWRHGTVGSTVGYPSDRLASCFELDKSSRTRGHILKLKMSCGVRTSGNISSRIVINILESFWSICIVEAETLNTFKSRLQKIHMTQIWTLYVSLTPGLSQFPGDASSPQP